MIGLDTSVLVRFLMQDDPVHAAAANAALAQLAADRYRKGGTGFADQMIALAG